jgi:hypothetical protein
MKDISVKYRNRKGKRDLSRFERLDKRLSTLNNYSLINTKGKAFEPRESFSERRYLSQKIVQYRQSLVSFRSENNRILSLIDEVADKKKDGSDSEDSEKNFYNFSLTRREKGSISRFPFTYQSLSTFK